MNKTRLAREIDHVLKSADFQKSVIKGMGWKGHGTPYRRSGFRINTKASKCVILTYYTDYDTTFLARHQEDLALDGRVHFIKSKDKMHTVLAKYKDTLRNFQVEEKTDEYGLPFLEIKDGKA